MKIFVDENIPLMTVRALREMGHDVLDIQGWSLSCGIRCKVFGAHAKTKPDRIVYCPRRKST